MYGVSSLNEIHELLLQVKLLLWRDFILYEVFKSAFHLIWDFFIIWSFSKVAHEYHSLWAELWLEDFIIPTVNHKDGERQFSYLVKESIECVWIIVKSKWEQFLFIFESCPAVVIFCFLIVKGIHHFIVFYDEFTVDIWNAKVGFGIVPEDRIETNRSSP